MYSWEDKIENFEKYLRSEKGASDNTILAYLHDIRSFIEFAKETYADEMENGNISLKAAESFSHHLRGYGLKGVTIARKIDALTLFYDHVNKAFSNINPFRRIPYPKAEYDRINSLSKDEIEQLLMLEYRDDFIGIRDRLMVELFYLTGLRLSELIDLNIADIFVKDDILCVRSNDGKLTRFDQWIATEEHLKAYLATRRELLEGKPYNGKKYEPLFLNINGKRISKRGAGRIASNYLKMVSNKPKLSTHSLRSSFAKHHLLSGDTIKNVQYQMGHSSPLVTYKYYPSKESWKEPRAISTIEYLDIKDALSAQANDIVKRLAGELLDTCWAIDNNATILVWNNNEAGIISFSIPNYKRQRNMSGNYFSIYTITNFTQDYLRCELSVDRTLAEGFIKEYGSYINLSLSKFRKRIQCCIRQNDMDIAKKLIEAVYNLRVKPQFMINLL